MLRHRSPIFYVVYLPLALLFVMLLITGGLVLTQRVELPGLGRWFPYPEEYSLPEYLPGEGTISGKLFLEDGSPNPYAYRITALIQGQYHGEPFQWTFSDTTTTKQGTEKFLLTRDAGELHLLFTSLQPDGFAPTYVGPIANIAGGDREDLRIVLQKGSPLEIVVVNPQGERIPSAQVKIIPYLAVQNSLSGTWLTATPLENGRFQFLQVEGLELGIEVTAKGYQGQTLKLKTTPQQSSTTITLRPALPTTGEVVDRSGKPVSGAKVVAQVEIRPDHAYFYEGESLASTNEQGLFELDSLRLDTTLHGYIEAPNQRRVLFENLQADQQNLKFEIPEYTLRGFLQGDLKKLPTTGILNRPSLKISQRVSFNGPNGLRAELVDDIVLSPTDEGGEFIYNGLIGEKVELEIGPHRAPFDYRAESNWRLDFDLATGKATFTPASQDPHFETPVPPASAQDWRGRLLKNRSH